MHYIGNRVLFETLYISMVQKTHLSLVQHHDPVTAHHCIEAMGDDQRGAAAERLMDGVLNQPVCLCVNGCHRLVQQQVLATPNTCHILAHFAENGSISKVGRIRK